MVAMKKPIYTPGESKMEEQARRFNKRALVGSIIIHLFFFLLKLPHLELEHKLKDDPKLIPIKMELVTPPSKSEMVRTKLNAAESELVTPPAPDTKVQNGTDRAVKNADRLGDKTQKNVQDVQKGDPGSRIKEKYKPGTEVRKTAKTTVGSGSAPSKVKATNNPGGSGDTYQGFDMTNVTDSIRKSGQGIKRAAAKGAKDDGGAGKGSGGGIGDGIGGGTGNGFVTGSPNGTPNAAKVANNIGSLTGSTRGKIDSSRGFDGLAQKGTVMVAGIPVEKIQVSTIDPDEIRRILREHIPQFRYCYQSELDTNKNPEGLQGRMLFRFKIGGSGSVTSSEIQSEEISSDKVRDCMKNVLDGIKFPSPSGGKVVEVSQPMNLYPKRM